MFCCYLLRVLTAANFLTAEQSCKLKWTQKLSFCVTQFYRAAKKKVYRVGDNVKSFSGDFPRFFGTSPAIRRSPEKSRHSRRQKCNDRRKKNLGRGESVCIPRSAVNPHYIFAFSCCHYILAFFVITFLPSLSLHFCLLL